MCSIRLALGKAAWCNTTCLTGRPHCPTAEVALVPTRDFGNAAILHVRPWVPTLRIGPSTAHAAGNIAGRYVRHYMLKVNNDPA